MNNRTLEINSYIIEAARADLATKIGRAAGAILTGAGLLYGGAKLAQPHLPSFSGPKIVQKDRTHVGGGGIDDSPSEFRQEIEREMNKSRAELDRAPTGRNIRYTVGNGIDTDSTHTRAVDPRHQAEVDAIAKLRRDMDNGGWQGGSGRRSN